MNSNVIFDQHRNFVAAAGNIVRAVTDLFDHVSGVIHHEYYVRELFVMEETGPYCSMVVVREVGWDHGNAYTMDHRINPNYNAMLQFMWVMYNAGYPVRFDAMIEAGFWVSDVEDMEQAEPAWLAGGEGMGDYFNPFADTDDSSEGEQDEDDAWGVLDEEHVLQGQFQAEDEPMEWDYPEDSGYEGSDEEEENQ